MKNARIVAALIGVTILVLPVAAIALPAEDESADVKLDPDFVTGKRAIDAKNWDAAIKAFSSAALRDTRNADIQNYLGYAYRKVGQLEASFRHYERALALSPRHRGAHEYIGEAYLVVDNLAKAEEHLAALQTICLIPCEEFEELKEKIEQYKSSKKQ
jgi:Flp pilus assembly protein TadD